MKQDTKKKFLAGVIGTTIGGVLITFIGKAIFEVGTAILVTGAGIATGWLAAAVLRKEKRT